MMSKIAAIAAAVMGAALIGPLQRPADAQPQPQRNPGVSNVCGEFAVGIDLILFEIEFDQRADEGWAYVDTAQKIRQATGIAQAVRVAANDTPANHDSHDLTFNLALDPNQDDLLSIQPDSALHIEWETGIKPTEKTGNGANRIFPKWAWPSAGDRVWVNGNWIFDCGHPVNGLFSTEIHPARAIASMRDQAAPLPGTGLTPVPVTLTDLHITGRGGYAPQSLNCGPQVILGPNGDNCGQDTPPADQSYKTTPINDTNFAFDVCLPSKPGNAVFQYRHEPGPFNTVHIDPQITTRSATDTPCIGDPRYDQNTVMHVVVPLANTATPPQAVYARRIYAGWVSPPDPILPHRRVTLTTTVLHEDHDFDSITGASGELSFWWLNVDRAESAWLRLNDFANGNMNSYDDDAFFGDGQMHFTNAAFDFYLRHGQEFTVRSMGFEQDCYDNAGNGAFFGQHELRLIMYVGCALVFQDHGTSDRLNEAGKSLTAADLGPKTVSAGDDYDLKLTIAEVPLANEDTSFLSIQTACTPDGEVAVAGKDVTCATQVRNAGPGLPRQVHVSNRFSGPAVTIKSSSWAVPAPFATGPHVCVIGSEAVCDPDTVPVTFNLPLTVTTKATPTAPGQLGERAEVTTASNDPDLSNNVATTSIEVFQPLSVVVAPRSENNEVNLKRGGTVTVVILTTDDFDAMSIDPLTLCFGDAGSPSERTCTEQHRTGHTDDLNKDRRPDLLLHFEVAATGIDPGDTSACIIGRTRTGTGVYGCDNIVTR
jgi:hypothetical protein